MKISGKNIIELVAATLFVLVGTAITYSQLESLVEFWNAQTFWNFALIVCWGIVAFGYYHQGWVIGIKKNSSGVSIILPISVFIVQCILFVKGVFYKDTSLIIGALMVNSGVTFAIYRIYSYRNNLP